jgi:radical SAM/Cys-rich protein
MKNPAAQKIQVVAGKHFSALPLPDHQPEFRETLRRRRMSIRRGKIKTLQINIGRKCDLACNHCHVEAGPKRTEEMEAETIDRIIEIASQKNRVDSIDITGGAPEMNRHFRRLVSAIRALGIRVIDRCNLTILRRPGQHDTAEFLADNKVEIIASLPCYTQANVEQQRGRGVFGMSIKALHTLNALGYGMPGNDLKLNLVYNPVGAHLPPRQSELEKQYKVRLREDLGIEFNALYTITNMPIKRYAHYLRRENLLEEYMQLLIDSFNPATVKEVMCTELVSVSWDGMIYDCDFNQMVGLPVGYRPTSLWDIESLDELPQSVAVDNHCYGCTAGTGSSCGGALQ